MNDNQKRNLIISVLLIVSILLIIYFDMMYFISGPYLRDDDTERIASAISETLGAESVEFIDRYVLDEEIYVYEVVSDLGDNIVFFGNNRIHAQLDRDTFDLSEVESYAESLYGEGYEVKLGYYDQKPIIALISDDREIIMDYYSYEELFIWNKRG